MIRPTHLIASALAVAAFTPAVASADHNALRGAPQMVRVDADTVQVKFVTDQRLARNGARIAVADAGVGRTVRAAGRHGDDFKYVARVNVDQDLEVGTKYRVRIKLGGDDAVVRQVILRAAR